MKECDNFSEDVKFWAEYKTGIKEFKPWLDQAEGKSHEGLAKPQTLDEANAMFATVKTFEGSCHKHFKVLLLFRFQFKFNLVLAGPHRKSRQRIKMC